MKKFLPLLLVLAVLSSCHKKETTVVCEQFTLDDAAYLTDDQQDSLTINLAMEYPTQIYPDSVKDRIQKDIMLHLFGDAFVEMEPQQALEAYAAMLKTEYKLNNQPLLEELLENGVDEEMRGAILCQEQSLSGSVMGIVKDIMSYGVERYVFLGGPHGNNYRLFVNFDLLSGKELREKDIFEEDYEDKLTELLLKNMVEQNDEIDLIKDLEMAGYNVDDIHPNDNFYLAEEGITYVFNPYEIAPYSMGETEILIPWEDAEPLLQSHVKEGRTLPYFLKKLF